MYYIKSYHYFFFSANKKHRDSNKKITFLPFLDKKSVFFENIKKVGHHRNSTYFSTSRQTI